MGYFYRFHKVPKDLVKEIQECKTHMEFLKLCYEHKIPVEHEECDPDPDTTDCKGFGTEECEKCECFDSIWVEIYEIGEEIFDLGGNDELANSIKEISTPLFFSNALNERYEHYGACICPDKAFEKAIKWYREQINKVYEDLLRKESANEYDTRPQTERWEEHIRSFANEWLNDFYIPYDLEKDRPACRSGKYEYLIFELVRAYKDFDFNNYELMFLGW
jgi:hypothetical protein